MADHQSAGLDGALDRLEAALDTLEGAAGSILERIQGADIGDDADGQGGAVEAARLRSERDALSAELSEMRGREAHAAALRVEAAEAVRSALLDLRGLLPDGRPTAPDSTDNDAGAGADREGVRAHG